MKVSLHELKHDVYVLELPWTRRQHDVLDLHNVCRSSNLLSCRLSQLSGI